jgi:hypothetical protein
MTGSSRWCALPSQNGLTGGTKATSTISTLGHKALLNHRARRQRIIGLVSSQSELRTAFVTAANHEEDTQWLRLKALCEALNTHEVDYLVFGSFAGLLHGVPLRTVDVDVVPEASDANLQRLCDALNSLEPRWRVDDVSEGVKIDGGKVEPRHIRGSSIAIGLVTTAGMVDVLIGPKGFEHGYSALAPSAIILDIGGLTIHVGALDDLIISKRLLAREKDLEHLPLLEARQAELRRSHGHDLDPGRDGPDRGRDTGPGIGF